MAGGHQAVTREDVVSALDSYVRGLEQELADTVSRVDRLRDYVAGLEARDGIAARRAEAAQTVQRLIAMLDEALPASRGAPLEERVKYLIFQVKPGKE